MCNNYYRTVEAIDSEIEILRFRRARDPITPQDVEYQVLSCTKTHCTFYCYSKILNEYLDMTLLPPLGGCCLKGLAVEHAQGPLSPSTASNSQPVPSSVVPDIGKAFLK